MVMCGRATGGSVAFVSNACRYLRSRGDVRFPASSLETAACVYRRLVVDAVLCIGYMRNTWRVNVVDIEWGPVGDDSACLVWMLLRALRARLLQ